jgi:hypothetical protein
MCQLDAKSPDSNAVTGKVSLSDNEKREIDYRVTARLAMIEDRKNQYMRGFWDCLYILAMLAFGVYIYWYSGRMEN